MKSGLTYNPNIDGWCQRPIRLISKHKASWHRVGERCWPLSIDLNTLFFANNFLSGCQLKPPMYLIKKNIGNN